MSSVTIGVKFDDNIRERLHTLGAAKDRAPQWLIKTAVQQYLEREEHAEQERREDEERWARYETTGQAISHAKAMSWLDSLAKGKRKPCPR